MFKTELIEFIRHDYKELKELDVNIDGKPLQGTLYNLLTPYLAHKNTIDYNNRIITFYTQEGSKQQKLLPFYIGLSNYYKAFAEIQSEYSESTLNDDSLESLLSSITNELPSKFSYLNKRWTLSELTIDIEKNNKMFLFIESNEKRPRTIAPQIQDILPNLRPFINDYNQLELKVEQAQLALDKFLEDNDEFIKFKKIRESSQSKIGINEILKLGSKINLPPSSGVLLFTNKTKYRKLIENTFINDKSITEIFSIAEIKFNSNGLEVIKTGVNKPIIYFCSSEFYAGWEEIKKELGVDYINTIVIDDFGSILQREIRNDFEYFREFSKSIIQAQKANELKDVYFLDEDSNFNHAKILANFELHAYPWLLNYQERASLSEQDINESCHKTVSIQDELGSRFWDIFKKIVLQLNGISRTESNLERKVVILSLLKNGYELLSRVTSFYHLSFQSDFTKLIEELLEFNKALESTSLNDKIEELKLLEHDEFHVNDKIKTIIELLLSGLTGQSVIVSRNIDENDIEYAKNFIADSCGHDVDFISLDELRPRSLKKYQNAFFLHFTGKVTRTLFLSRYCNNQYLILNNRSESGYYIKCFHDYAPEIAELSDFDNKLILLNIEEQEGLIERHQIEYNIDDYLEYRQSKPFELSSKVNSNNELSSEHSVIDEQDFSFVIENLLTSETFTSDSNFSESNQDSSYLLLFRKSFIKAPAWKHFHVLEEDESKKQKKRITDLDIGDKVFIMEGFNNDFNELLTFLVDEHEPLKKHFDAANSWRLDLHHQYDLEGGYYTRLNNFLNNNGVHVTNPTVEKWISGVTIMPDSLIQIINLFQHNKDSHCSRHNSKSIVDSTRWLAKFRTKLHKEIFQYHVFQKNGMYQQINDLELRHLVHKMNDIVRIEEVIMIQKQ